MTTTSVPRGTLICACIVSAVHAAQIPVFAPWLQTLLAAAWASMAVWLALEPLMRPAR